MDHLVYCDKKASVLNKLLSGEKTKIIRGASGRKLPYGRVFKGEKLYFVETDGTSIIRATAIVKSVFNSEVLSFDESKQIIYSMQNELKLTGEQQKRWIGKKRLCIIEVENVQPIDHEMIYDRQDNMDDWITVSNIHDILVGSSKVYQSIRIK